MTRSSKKGSRLQNDYILYLEIGFILALIILITAAHVDLTPNKNDFQVHLKSQEVVQMKEIQQTEQQTKAPQPPKAPVPVEVPDNTVLEQEDVNFDASLNLSASLDTSAGPRMPDEPSTTSTDHPEDEIFVIVEEEPKLIGGMKALQEEIEYPTFAEKAGIEGRVFVQFVVDKAGNVQDPEITRGVHELLNKEALRVVKQMKFEPGKQRGKPVKVQLTLPVNFELRDAPPPSDS